MYGVYQGILFPVERLPVPKFTTEIFVPIIQADVHYHNKCKGDQI
jgi:hypothetical protein